MPAGAIPPCPQWTAAGLEDWMNAKAKDDYPHLRLQIVRFEHYCQAIEELR